MREEISPWSQPESEHRIPILENEEKRFAQVEKRYFEAEEAVQKIKMDKKNKPAGNGSFFDITGNLLIPVASAMYAYEHTKKLELLELSESNLDYLDRYLAVLESDPNIRMMELSNSAGAYPEARRAANEAKELGHAAIPTYIDMITGAAGDGHMPN